MPCKKTKIAILGGSGMTGLCVVKEAINSGISARLLLRPDSVLPEDLESNVEIVRGDATNLESVEEAIKGTDGVVVALGTRNQLGPTVEMSKGVSNALGAMKKFGIKPITVCLSSFLFMPDGAVPPVFKEINEEHGRMLSALEASDADWVAVMPPHIADIPATAYMVRDGALPGGRVVSKLDLASFLVKALSQPEHYKKKMGISSKSDQA